MRLPLHLLLPVAFAKDFPSHGPSSPSQPWMPHRRFYGLNGGVEIRPGDLAMDLDYAVDIISLDGNPKCFE